MVARFRRDVGHEERYGAIRVASNCAEADLVDWLQENFDAAWVEPLPTGGSAVNLAILDDDVILSENLENLSDVGRPLAEVGGVACILSWPHHIHFEGDSIEEAQSWERVHSSPTTLGTRKTSLSYDTTHKTACPESMWIPEQSCGAGGY